MGVRECVVIGGCEFADWAALVGVSRHARLSLVSGGEVAGARGAGGPADCGEGHRGCRPRGAGVVVYARVSWRDQRADLERRVARVTVWATAKDFKVGSWSPRLDPA